MSGFGNKRPHQDEWNYDGKRMKQGGPNNDGYYQQWASGDQYQGDQYQGDQYQGDQYQGDQYQGDQYQGDQYQGDQDMQYGYYDNNEWGGGYNQNNQGPISQMGRGRGRGGRGQMRGAGNQPMNQRGRGGQSGPPRGGGPQRGGQQPFRGQQRGRGRGAQKATPPNQNNTVVTLEEEPEADVPMDEPKPVTISAAMATVATEVQAVSKVTSEEEPTEEAPSEETGETGEPGETRRQREKKNKPPPPDFENMTIEERIQGFCTFLKNDTSVKFNGIQTIMNGLNGAKLGFKANYEAEELTRIAHKPMYTGVLKLDDIFLARAVCTGKKELKQKVFQKALDILLSQSVEEIFSLKDPGVDVVRAELLSQMGEDSEMDIKPEFLAGNKADASELIGLDLEKSLTKLKETVLKMKSMPDNPVSIVEQAITQSHCLIKHSFNCDAHKMNNGRFYYQGYFVLGGIVLGRGHGLKKKICKNCTYQTVLGNLKLKKVEQLMVSVPEEGLPKSVNLKTKKSPRIVVAPSNLPLEERLENFVKAMGTLPFKESLINPVDLTAMQHGLSPMLVYRVLPDETNKFLLTCEVFIDRIHIATSEGVRKRECMLTAYSKAWDVLTTVSVETMIKEHSRFGDEDFYDPNILAVIIKGTGRSVDSNSSGLRRLGYDISKVMEKKKEDLIIMEHRDWYKDRVRNAFNIMQFSCTQNGMILHWETEMVNQDVFLCIMRVQTQEVGRSYGRKKNHARNLAATDALFKLYQTNDVLLITYRDDTAVWVTREVIKAEADKLRADNIGDEPIMKNDEKGNPLPDAFIMKALSIRLKDFKDAGNAGELVFGPGMSYSESRELRDMARELNLHWETRQHLGQPYTVFYEKLELRKIVEILKEKTGQYSKFTLAKKEDLPKYEEIEKNIQKEVPKPEDLTVDVKIEHDEDGNEEDEEKDEDELLGDN